MFYESNIIVRLLHYLLVPKNYHSSNKIEIFEFVPKYYLKNGMNPSRKTNRKIGLIF